MKEFTIQFAVMTVLIFLLTVVAERILIPILRSRKLGQKILDIGPRWHKGKEGTPTMGGIGFILASLSVTAVFFIVHGVRGDSADYIPLALTLAYAVANGAVGFVDDYVKLIVKRENEGLTARQKLILQLALAAAYVCVMAYTGNLSTAVPIPFTDLTVELGWFYYPLAILVLAGVVNGGNITDGIDGLAASVTCVIGLFFALWAFTSMSDQLSVASAVLIGSSVGFLVYNFYPARVFMGDTGSLFFGSLVIGCGFMMNNPLAVVIASLVFTLEMLSSLLQMLYFRLTKGKRLFKMAPIHHHFEQCGWHECVVMIVFTLVAVLFCLLAWLGM